MRKPRKGLYLILAFSLFLNLLLPPLAIANEEPGTSSNACVETIVEEVDGEEAVPSTPEETDSFTTEDAEPTTITEENSAAVDDEEAASVDEDESSIEDEGNVEETTPSDEEDNSSPTEDVTEETPQPCEEESDEQLDNSLNNGLMAKAIDDDINIITDVKIWNHPTQDGEPTPGLSKEIQDIRPELNERVSVEYFWKLPPGHSYSEGDTFTFQLPSKFELGLDLSGSLVSGEVGVVGEFIVTPEGQIIFTFNDKINGGEGFTGNFYVWRQFDASKLEDSTKQDIIFDIKDGAQVTIPLHFKKDGAGINKSGKAYQKDSENNRNSDNIKWVVDFNLGEETIQSAILTDKVPSGLTIDLSSCERHC